ncbi:MAG: phage tail protein [Magnetococcales bacterium]|nr:phage tail protein [Magnetococcales bacterium]
MLATIRVNSHPLLNRGMQQIAIDAPCSIASRYPTTMHYTIAILNGKPVLRAQWGIELSDGDILDWYIIPQGGGGGGSNPMTAVMMLAGIFILPGIGGMLGASMGLSTATIAGIEGFSVMGMFKAAFTVGALTLFSAVVGTPKTPQPQAMASMASPSPTYSVSAQGNSARIDSPIPVHYGRLKFPPEFAAMPYTEYSGNEQYLYQLFCLGVGEFSVESITIQDTPITSFEEITTEIIEPGGTISLFPANVITSVEVSGQEAKTNDPLGPFVANAAGTLANAIAIDIICPRGIGWVNNDGGVEERSITWKVETRTIDDLGSPVGDYVTLATVTLKAHSSTPQRRSYRYTVPPGRYQVRLTRTDEKEDGDSRYLHDLNWAGLRSYLPETRDFGPVTLLAVRMRATDNISAQASRQINVIATRKVRSWDPISGWNSSAASRSIAWAIADVATNPDYGAGMLDSRVDLAALYNLDLVWSARGDCFDGRFDSQTTVFDALTKIAITGRAKVYMQGGILRVFRDSAVTVPVALFTMRNMIKGSFAIEMTPPTDVSANYCDVGYWDGDVWAARRVEARLPGVDGTIPAKLDTFGITGRDQACHEGAYYVATSLYRRTIIHFVTEQLGYLPSLGDLIAIQHDMPAWGQHGEITAWDGDLMVATLSDPLVWTDGATHYLGMMKRDGSLDGPYAVTRYDDDDSKVQFSEGPGTVPHTILDEIRTHIAFGPGEAWRRQARVISIKPQSLYRVAIDAVVEDARVHAADTTIIVPPPNESTLATLLTVPDVTGLKIITAPGEPNKVLITWDATPGAEYYIIEESMDGETWQRMIEPRGTSAVCEALYGPDTIVRISAVNGVGRGAWTTKHYAAFSPFMWTGSDDDPFWTADNDLFWRS